MEAQIFMVKLAEAIRKERRSQSYRISEKSLEAYVLKDALSGKETVCLRNRWRYPLQPCSFSLAFQLYIYIYIYIYIYTRDRQDASDAFKRNGGDMRQAAAASARHSGRAQLILFTGPS